MTSGLLNAPFRVELIFGRVGGIGIDLRRHTP
jgi:hypothetical protein